MTANAKYTAGLLTVIGDPAMLAAFVSMSNVYELTDIAQGNLAALLALVDSTEAPRDPELPASNWKKQLGIAARPSPLKWRKHMTKYRVWNFVNLLSKPDHYPVNSPEHGAELINALANSQLLDESITDNAFGLEVFEDGEWTEWMDEGGNDVDYLCDEVRK